MALASLLALIDDIAAVLDDVSAMTQVAARKTAAVMGDDLAVNAEKVIGVSAARELPVIWAVAKGSLVNKAILVPAALLVAAVAPWLVTPMLVCGGLFLCFEGAEKLLHRPAGHKHPVGHKHPDRSKHSDGHKHTQVHEPPAGIEKPSQTTDETPIPDSQVSQEAIEKAKIRGAVRTDFILSLEIIVLTLAVVESSPWPTQLGVLAGISLLMVVGVYGLVAGIVKVDDLGLYLVNSGEPDSGREVLGRALLAFAPRLMKSLSVVGTVAMFLVGGGILLHASHTIEHELLTAVGRLGVPDGLSSPLLGGVIGVMAGALLVGMVTVSQRMFTAAD